MCLAIPMKIVSLDGAEGIVEGGSLRRRANFTLLKDPAVGDYILLHAGFAIGKVKEKEAKRTLKLLKEL